jgi:hypothetical protein
VLAGNTDEGPEFVAEDTTGACRIAIGILTATGADLNGFRKVSITI